jgi:hypothetical protein
MTNDRSAETPEGLRYFDSDGYDPVYGIKLKPVTPGIIEKYKKQQMKMYPKQIFLENREKAAAEREKGEAEKERQKRLAYPQKYINPYSSNSPGLKEVAILVIDEKLREEYDIEKKLVSILKLQGKNPVLSIFKKPFIEDGIFERVFSGNLDIIKSLSLYNQVDYVILSKKYSKSRKNPQVWDGISSDLTIQIKVIATNPIKVVNAAAITTIGPGYTNEEAEKNALNKAYNDLQEFLKELK